MKLLALDTSSDTCSCALSLDGDILARVERAPRRHAERLLPMIQDLLADAGLSLGRLDALAFGRGPGSFTGLRIAAGVAQGLGRGADRPVVPVSSLRALAQGGARTLGIGHAIALFDARMGEVYVGCYERAADGLMAPVEEERVCPPDALELPAGADPSLWRPVGAGWKPYGEVLGARLGIAAMAGAADLDPDARDVAVLGEAGFARGEAVDAALAVPVYLRNRVAATRRERSGEPA